MRRSVWLSLGLILSLSLWMGSGYWGASSRAKPSTPERTTSRVHVGVIISTAQIIQRKITVRGQTKARRIVKLRAEIPGRIVDIPSTKGTRIKHNDVVAKISIKDRQAKVREANALVKQRAAELKAARDLERRQMQAKSRVDELTALYEAARAYQKRAQVELGNTQVRAPFSAIINDYMIEMGDFIDKNHPIAELVDDSVLKVAANVSQRDVGRLTLGESAQVTLITGEVLTGRLTYIAARAEMATRSFPVEIEIPNPEYRYAPGMSATVSLPLDEQEAHFISLSSLTLNDQGEIGVKAVDTQEQVRFFPTKLVRSDAQGAWVSGLPRTTHIITRGQGFVRAGDKVKVTVLTADKTPLPVVDKTQ